MAITKIQSESLNLADTYAFTGTVTGTPTGLNNAHLWYYTSTTTVGTSDVKLTNWSAHNGSEIGSIGTDMTHSSGNFTFPSTGIWLIQARIGYYITGSSEARFIYSNIRSSTNSGSSYTLVDEAVSNIANVDSGSNDLGTTFNQYILDVTDASTQRIAIYAASASTIGQIETYNKATNLLFTRLGDT